MRDLDAFLNSLVNIDRDSLVAILSSEAEAAERLANSIRTRTSTQRLKRQQAVECAARDMYGPVSSCRKKSKIRLIRFH